MTEGEVLLFEPDSQLTFDKRGNEPPIHVNLRLTNTSKALDVLFRVQTTSPTVYRVRPSHGRIPANSHIDVQVVMVSEPVKADKFLVKYVTVAHSLPHGEFLKQFKEAEGSARERRLRVSVLGGTVGAGSEAGSAADGVGSGQGSSSGNVERKDSIDGDRMTPAQSHAASSASLAGMSQESLIAELREARAKIQALAAKNQELSRSIDETKGGLRRRTEQDEIEHPATKIPRGISEAELDSLIRAQSGFPPVLVILIAVFSFLVGLLF